MNGLVSAIITTHNRSDLAIKAIESVVNQTYSNIEIIVVDDASCDEQRENLNKYIIGKNINYIYIEKKESTGGNHARNVGIGAADGEYFAFLDDDDQWLPEKIEKQVEYLEKHRDCGFVACGKQYEVDFGIEKFEDDVALLPEGNLSDFIMYNIPFTTSAIMLRRDVLEKSGYFDETLKYWQEYELEMRLAQITTFGVVRENLVLYRIIRTDKNRLTNRTDGWYETVKKINRKHKKLIKSKGKYIGKERVRLIANDGINRAAIAGTGKRRYLFMLFYTNPSIARFLKAILGVCRYREICWVSRYLKYRNRT